MLTERKTIKMATKKTELYAIILRALCLKTVSLFSFVTFLNNLLCFKSFAFTFAKGERVRFTKNDYARNFTNGALGTVTDIEQVNDDIYFSIVLDNGDKTRFKKSEYSDEHGRLYLAQAYVSTIYSSQGATVDGDTFLFYNSRMDRALSYVAGSRHKDNCHWFVNREEVESLVSDQSQVLEEEQIIELMGRNMDIDRKNSFALEYLEANEKELSNSNRIVSELTH